MALKGEACSGLAVVLGLEASSVRAIASTDLMEQVRALLKHKGAYPAAPIVLAGAPLETALRGDVETAEPALAGNGSLTALRRADLIAKREMKDIEQVSGLLIAAAHGDFDGIAQAHASLWSNR